MFFSKFQNPKWNCSWEIFDGKKLTDNIHTDKLTSKQKRQQELRGGRYSTCIWWNNYSMQCRSSKKRVMVCAIWKSNQSVYARFHTHSHHCCREMYFNSSLDIKFGQSQWSMKRRSRAPGHCVCSKSVWSTITMLRFHTPSYHCYKEMYFNTRLNIKFWQSVEHEI